MFKLLVILFIMLLGQFCFGNSLLMNIRKNTDCLWQKPQQLPSAEANFEGDIACSTIAVAQIYRLSLGA